MPESSHQRLGFVGGKRAVRISAYMSTRPARVFPLPSQKWPIGDSIDFSNDVGLLPVSTSWIEVNDEEEGFELILTAKERATRTKAETDSEEVEKRVRDIRRATRRQYSVEEKTHHDCGMNVILDSFERILNALRLQQQLPALSQAITASPHQLRDLQPAVLGFPFIVSSRTNPVLAPNLVGRQPGIRFPQDLHDLAFRKSRPFHANLPAKSCQKVLLPACLG
jgi:hypothetical protein